MSTPTLRPDPDAVDLDAVDLSERVFWGEPPEVRHAVFDRLRRERPFAFFAEPVVPFIEPGAGYHAVTRYADVAAISSQPALFSSGAGAVSIADMPPDLNEFYGSLISMDDPRHGKIRRIVAKAFTPRVLEQLVGSVQAVVDDVVTRARRTAAEGDGTIDVVRDLAAPVPLRVICDMMGIPEGDRAMVLEHSTVILSGGDPELVQDEALMVTAFLRAGEELAGLMARLAAQRHAHPADDLTTALVSTEVDGERLTRQEIASFFILLLVAGNETTRNAISQGVLALSEHPAERDRWAADPGLTRTAVEEVVRWTSPITWMRRTATQDVELSGQRFPAGSKFLLFYGAANRDPAVFPRPAPLRPLPRPQPARRVRFARPALLPRRAPGPPRDRRRLPGLRRPAPRPGGDRPAGPVAVLVRQRAQTAAGAAEGGGMTRVVVDREVCMSAGVCELEAPDVFELDADGRLQVGEPTDLAAVETAVRACPTGALQLLD